MAQQANQPRQKSWIVSSDVANPMDILQLGHDFKTGKVLGTNANVAVNINGSPLGVNIKGDVDEAMNDLRSLANTEYLSASFQAQHPHANNVRADISLATTDRRITISLHGSDEKQAQIIFDYVSARFLRAPAPTEEETADHLSRLSTLIDEAEKAADASKLATSSNEQIRGLLEQCKNSFNNINEQTKQAKSSINDIANNKKESTQHLAEINNLKVNAQADADATRSARESTGAIEAKIRQFFDEIDSYQNTITESKKASEEAVRSFEQSTDSIITKNVTLQDEIKEHLQKAVGASLFSAFQKRKEQVSKSKWIWASLLSVAIIAQIVVLFWLATTAIGTESNQPFYLQPIFLLRALSSIPIIFFIGYAIKQYTREREIEELYSFKSALSFSLSPYLDLVETLSSKKQAEPYRDFAVTTISQIFEDPTKQEEKRVDSRHKDDALAKDLLDRLIEFVEKAKS